VVGERNSPAAVRTCNWLRVENPLSTSIGMSIVVLRGGRLQGSIFLFTGVIGISTGLEVDASSSFWGVGLNCCTKISGKDRTLTNENMSSH